MKNQFFISLNWDDRKLNLMEVSELLASFLIWIARYDIHFLKMNMLMKGKDDVVINTIELEKSGTLINLIQQCLYENKEVELKDIGKEYLLNSKFEEEVGFTTTFYSGGVELEQFVFKVTTGAYDFPGNGVFIDFPNSFSSSFEWYFNLFKNLVEFFNPKWGAVLLKFMIKEHLPFRPPGYITYYSNSVKVPDLPSWVNIDRGKNGRILTLDHENILSNKATYQKYKQLIMDLVALFR
ncbi:hypothetical protein [Flavisolibacter tropicus]|uniref:Immunity protein 52 domain-containing protein n=1 Tax=Flavisolibacter tropicus TaxID=1492898 RepID=A0A172U0P3_9BACT|nr:hypothetical protein [Flavisolibacter tropicus]ANE52826.1 hypothetical protein SY85_22465 [Flavisolibacter tropicus]